MNQQQLAEQMQELIDFRDVTLAADLADKVEFYGDELHTHMIAIDLSGQEFVPEIVRVRHVDHLGNTRQLKFTLQAQSEVYRVEIDE